MPNLRKLHWREPLPSFYHGFPNETCHKRIRYTSGVGWQSFDMMTNNCDDLQLYNMMRMIDGHSLDLDDVSYEGRGEVKIGTHLVINMINSQNQPPHKHLLQSESHWSRILNRSPWVSDKAKQWSDSGKFDNHQHHLYHHHHFCDAGKVEEEGDIPRVGDLVAHLSKKIQIRWSLIVGGREHWTTLFVSSYLAARPSWLPCQRPPCQPGLHGWKF